MARRVYTPRSRPNRGANIRIGHVDIVDHIDLPVGSALLRKGSVDACGAISARRGNFRGVSESARAAMYGRENFDYTQPPLPDFPPDIDTFGVFAAFGDNATITGSYITPSSYVMVGSELATTVSTTNNSITFTIPTGTNYGDAVVVFNPLGPSSGSQLYLITSGSGSRLDSNTLIHWNFDAVSNWGRPDYAWHPDVLTLDPWTTVDHKAGKVGTYSANADANTGIFWQQPTVVSPNISATFDTLNSITRGTGGCTVEFWYKPISMSLTAHQYPGVFGFGAEGSGQSILGLYMNIDNTTRILNVLNTSGTNNYQAATPTITATIGPDDVWQHLAIRLSATTLSLFRNGEQFYSGTLAARPLLASPNWMGIVLGSSMNSQGTAYGYNRSWYDDVRISNIARTDQEILHSYLNGV